VRVLVTGAAGFIGSQVARLLVARGDEVTALLRPGGSRERISDLGDRIRFAEAALEDHERVAFILRELRPETVVHLAWYARPGDYLSSNENLRSLAGTNLLATHAFAAGCRKLVGAGSCVEYSSSDTARREADPTEPRTLYGACKRAASLVVGRLGQAAGAEVAWARIFHVHGPGEDRSRLVPTAAASLAAGQVVDVSPGDQVRDHLHVKDVASALVHLTGPGLLGPFNVASGVGVTLKHLLTTVGEIVGVPELLRFGARPYAAAEEHHLVGDPSRLRDAGWAPSWPDLRASLADAVAAYRRAVPR
jgi:dTDP-6-deoxy-L-talose 4-dehydrogenase (NAD+)